MNAKIMNAICAHRARRLGGSLAVGMLAVMLGMHGEAIMASAVAPMARSLPSAGCQFHRPTAGMSASPWSALWCSATHGESGAAEDDARWTLSELLGEGRSR